MCAEIWLEVGNASKLVGDFQGDQYIAVFDWPLGVLDKYRAKARTLAKDRAQQLDLDTGRIPREGKNDRDAAMLVPIGELPQQPQRIAVQLPRRERLYLPNIGPETRVNSLTAGRRVASGPRAVPNRECDALPPTSPGLGFRGQAQLPLDGKGPDQLVECGSEVVDRIANDRSEFQGRYRLIDIEPDIYLRPLEIKLSFEAIWIQYSVPLDEAVRFADVFFAPSELFEDAEKEIGHGQ
ncbi:MAG: hypothetical protein WD050_03095 [Actinomycetota bacterium]